MRLVAFSPPSLDNLKLYSFMKTILPSESKTTFLLISFCSTIYRFPPQEIKFVKFDYKFYWTAFNLLPR